MKSNISIFFGNKEKQIVIFELFIFIVNFCCVFYNKEQVKFKKLPVNTSMQNLTGF
jgi:hypothetical protein